MIGDLLRESIPYSIRRAARVGLRQARRLPLLVENRAHYECPCCSYQGKFLDEKQAYGVRKNARCPSCGVLERHRLQRCVLDELFREGDLGGLSVLHVAPDPTLEAYLSGRAGRYVAADIAPRGNQIRADLRRLQFEDECFDLVYASHVLEHIDRDDEAIAEVRRVLRPGGVALLPVPVVSDRTIEYPHPVPVEHGHVRAPGMDYFERYRRHFTRVELRFSADYAECYQLYVYEDRSGFPNRFGPFRPPMPGDRHLDVVPVCHA
jgi:SAM-dependent methyltransferase